MYETKYCSGKTGYKWRTVNISSMVGKIAIGK
jgi:hypothetical protein